VSNVFFSWKTACGPELIISSGVQKFPTEPQYAHKQIHKGCTSIYFG